jgi:hypothetical protein
MSSGMTAGGDYDAHSEYQMRGAMTSAELIDAAVADIDPAARDTLVIADYGCAQGRVTNALIHGAITRTRRTHRDVPIAVYHNDVLSNDWPTLLDRLRQPDSYLAIPGGPITPLISAISFYEPATPPGIVDLGLSFAAAQWLAAPGPSDTGSALYFDQLSGAPRDAMVAQAHADWTRFLARRAAELAPGGRLIVNMMGIGDDGLAAGHDAWEHVRSVCADLAAAGRIDDGRLAAYVAPIYERTADEVRRPFDGELAERLRLERLDLVAVDDPMTARYRRDGDADALARDFTGFFRAFSEPSLRDGLALGDDAAQDLYRRLAHRIRATADAFRFDVTTATLVARRHAV